MKQSQQKMMSVIKLMDANLQQVNNFLRAQNAQLSEANAGMEKNFTKEQIEQIDKELQEEEEEEEDEQAARYGIDINELERSTRELENWIRLKAEKLP
jgi:hypothetical protein